MASLDAERLLGLLEAAREAREGAYAPYSRFQVGAAVLTDDGLTVPGVNVENASYGLTVCAERSAVFSAVTTGGRVLTAVAVVSSSGGETWPCGACRQVLHEFGPGMVVVTEDGEGRPVTRGLDELLPEAFGPSDLP